MMHRVSAPLNKHGDLSFFLNIFDLPFILSLFKELEKTTCLKKKTITRNAFLAEMKSWPREHARKEGFKSTSSDTSSICHKTSSKLFLVIDILHLVHCFKICFNHVLPFPMESSVNWSNKHVFVRWNCKELWGNLRRWYLVNGHGDLFFLFYISKHCTIDNNLWKIEKKSSLKFYFGAMTLSLLYNK